MEPDRSVIRLREHAISQSLFPPATVAAAIDRLGFVQADPIRSPARAQDLILRHRVRDYRAGDLERQYEALDIEEDYLYAYGFLSKPVWQLLHPRKTAPPRAFERKVLETVVKLGEVHPRVLESHLGKRRVINAWGGHSKATTHALEWLHWRGLLRIARRENGIRIYRPAALPAATPMPVERLRALIMVYARIFAPSPEKSLQSVIARHRDLGNTRKTLAIMIHDGELRREIVDGVGYLSLGDALDGAAPREVRFLAPFDPIVWDRARFERLWGWPYRFEAYTPVKKRVRGYYAMPMLWGSEFVGWANVGLPRRDQGAAKPDLSRRSGAAAKADALAVDVGFVNKRPGDPEFGRQLDAEIARIAAFLQPPRA
jgi:uncharacterized protein YcaQ